MVNKQQCFHETGCFHLQDGPRSVNFRIQVFWMQRCIAGLGLPDVSMEHSAFIFIPEEEGTVFL